MEYVAVSDVTVILPDIKKCGRENSLPHCMYVRVEQDYL